MLPLIFLTFAHVQADFMKMPFADSNFDAIYAIEATCHAPDAVGTHYYDEISKILF